MSGHFWGTVCLIEKLQRLVKQLQEWLAASLGVFGGFFSLLRLQCLCGFLPNSALLEATQVQDWPHCCLASAELAGSWVAGGQALVATKACILACESSRSNELSTWCTAVEKQLGLRAEVVRGSGTVHGGFRDPRFHGCECRRGMSYCLFVVWFPVTERLLPVPS